MKRLIVFLFLLLFGAACSRIDWSKEKPFPCTQERACTDSYICQRGFCVPEGTIPSEKSTDSGTKDDKPSNKIRAAFLYNGAVADFGWTWAHEQSRLHLKRLGYTTTSIPFLSKKNAPEEMEQLLSKGYNLIVGTSYDFLEPMLAKAKKNPKVKFLECAGFKTGNNLGSYFGRIYQAEWLAGKIAGEMTKTDKVGIVASVAIAEVVRHVNAFTNGVRSVNPKAVVIVKWVGSWFDSAKETSLAQELLDLNTDVIHIHTNTTTPLEHIENKGKAPLTTKDGSKAYTIAYNSVNGCKFGPRTCLTSVYWNWGPLLLKTVKSMEAGKWDPSKIIWEQLLTDKEASSFHLSAFSSEIPGAVRIDVQNFYRKLADGKVGQQLPFKGPQHDNQGKERLSKGAVFTDKNLLDMCWYVEGIVQDDGKTPAVVPKGCFGDK